KAELIRLTQSVTTLSKSVDSSANVDASEGKLLTSAREELESWKGRLSYLLGNIYRSQSRENEALAAYKSSLASYRQTGDRASSGFLLETQADYLAELRRDDEALKVYDDAIGEPSESPVDQLDGDRRIPLLAKSGVLNLSIGNVAEGQQRI